MIDTHCHLDAPEFAADRDACHAAALAAGITAMVIPAVTVNGFLATKTTAARYPGCHAAYGIHPLYVMQAAEQDLLTLRQWLASEKPVAVGEIGLDGYVPELDPVRQELFYVAQLKLAREFALPVLLHVRRAVDQVLKHLRRVRVVGGIAHAFNGSRQQADEFIKLGFKLGFGGAMTYSGSTRIRALARELPLESIVLETDAPDIPPAWLAGQRHPPASLMRIAQTLAELRTEPLEHILVQTTQSARQVLPGI